MHKKFLAALLIIFMSTSSHAASLWNDNRNWFADERPGKVGDIVTVLVNERTDAKDEASMEVTKASNNNVSDGTGILKFLRALTFQSANSSEDGDSCLFNH